MDFEDLLVAAFDKAADNVRPDGESLIHAGVSLARRQRSQRRKTALCACAAGVTAIALAISTLTPNPRTAPVLSTASREPAVSADAVASMSVSAAPAPGAATSAKEATVLLRQYLATKLKPVKLTVTTMTSRPTKPGGYGFAAIYTDDQGSGTITLTVFTYADNAAQAAKPYGSCDKIAYSCGTEITPDDVTVVTQAYKLAGILTTSSTALPSSSTEITLSATNSSTPRGPITRRAPLPLATLTGIVTDPALIALARSLG